MVNLPSFILFSFFFIGLIAMIVVGVWQVLVTLKWREIIFSKEQFNRSLRARNKLRYVLVMSFIVVIGYLILVIRYVGDILGIIFFSAYGFGILFVTWSTYFYHNKYCNAYIQRRESVKKSSNIRR